MRDSGRLHCFIEAVDKANIPDQLFGCLSKLAGQGATMVPSRQLVPELKKLLDAEMATLADPRDVHG